MSVLQNKDVKNNSISKIQLNALNNEKNSKKRILQSQTVGRHIIGIVASAPLKSPFLFVLQANVYHPSCAPVCPVYLCAVCQFPQLRVLRKAHFEQNPCGKMTRTASLAEILTPLGIARIGKTLWAIKMSWHRKLNNLCWKVTIKMPQTRTLAAKLRLKWF